jgi:hypothetical protein
MDQLVASVTVALVLLALVLRDVLVDHGNVVRVTSAQEGARRDDVLDAEEIGGSGGLTQAEGEAAA